MHSVEYYELIRRKHFVDGMSLRAIAKELGHSRKFVRKAVGQPVPPWFRIVLNPICAGTSQGTSFQADVPVVFGGGILPVLSTSTSHQNSPGTALASAYAPGSVPSYTSEPPG